MGRDESICAEIRRVSLDPERLPQAVPELIRALAEAHGVEMTTLALGIAYYTNILAMRQRGFEPRALDLDRAASRIARLASGDLAA